MPVIALIVAAGRGSRAGEGLPKQYRSLVGKPVLTRTLEAFLSHTEVDQVAVVIHPDDRELYEQSIAELGPFESQRLLPPAAGGETRQDSARQGLEGLAAADGSVVLVHDAARPFVTPELFVFFRVDPVPACRDSRPTFLSDPRSSA